MKYTILGFSQKVMLKYNMTIEEACVLRWLMDFRDTERMRKLKIETEDDETIYYWVNYSYLAKDLPIIIISKFKAKRILNSMIKKGILKKYVYNNNETFFALNTNVIKELLLDREEDNNRQELVKVIKISGHSKSAQGGRAETAQGGCATAPTNPSTNNPSTNNIRDNKLSLSSSKNDDDKDISKEKDNNNGSMVTNSDITVDNDEISVLDNLKIKEKTKNKLKPAISLWLKAYKKFYNVDKAVFSKIDARNLKLIMENLNYDYEKFRQLVNAVYCHIKIKEKNKKNNLDFVKFELGYMYRHLSWYLAEFSNLLKQYRKIQNEDKD
ncbi:MAG: hypothetical protein QW474_02990 [Candidatus Aenigmatarchaeota archaeon]